VEPSTSHERTLLDSGQRTTCVLPNDQLCTTVPLITDKQETAPIFHVGIKYWKSMKILILKNLKDFCGFLLPPVYWSGSIKFCVVSLSHAHSSKLGIHTHNTHTHIGTPVQAHWHRHTSLAIRGGLVASELKSIVLSKSGRILISTAVFFCSSVWPCSFNGYWSHSVHARWR